MSLSQPNVINQPGEYQPERRQLPTYKTKVHINAKGQTEVIYHQTAVVTFDTEKIILDTGGWWTRSTKTRMNQVSEYYNLGFRVFQKAGEWFVDYQDNILPFTKDILALNKNEKIESNHLQANDRRGVMVNV
jgi:hypothetical protein